MKVAFCSSEVFPFAKTGGLADVCGTLPIVLGKLGIEVKIVMPHYKIIKDSQFNIKHVNAQYSKSLMDANVEVLFLENDEYFDRDGIYGDSSGDFPDNLERFHFYCLHSLKLLKKIGWKPDIIHCHDWHAALIPVYLKELAGEDSFFQNIKSVLTIHNLAYQGIFPVDDFDKLCLPPDLLSEDGFLFYDNISLLKAGIIFSDEITTVSPQYATEIQTENYGCGLSHILNHYKHGVVGILNGLDYDYWSPKKDQLIRKNYDKDSFVEGKLENKIGLQKEADLPVDIDVPLFGFVGRLSHQKGIDLIIDAIKELREGHFQMIIQGMGDPRYEKELIRLADDTDKQISLAFEFNERLAHMIYAGSDWFMMPSQFEPCGLAQMISMHYGTPPIVYRTGGLADTVETFDMDSLSGNGLMFQDNHPRAFIEMIRKAENLFHQKNQFVKLIQNAMDACFTWEASAKKYINFYQCLLSD